MGVLNVVTSVFCQSAIDSAQHDSDAVIHNQIQNDKLFTSKLKKLFGDIDKNNSGLITLEEFQQNLEHAEIRAYLNSLELSTHDAWTLFQLLDVDGTLTIDLDEFVMGCTR